MTTERPELSSTRQPIDIPRDRRGRICWRILKRDPQLLSLAIEDQARQFLQETGGLTQRLLAEKKRNDLAVAIGRFYPGGISQLKTDLGNGPDKKPDGYWQLPENILEEARQFLSTHEAISQRLLNRSGNSGLSRAISLYYPGGTRQLRRDLSLSVPRRPNQFWNEDTIEQEARDFYEQHGGLSAPQLLSEGKNDLLVAIDRKYPNKWPGLYEKLGLYSPQKEKGYWSVDRIEQEAQEFYIQHGMLSGTSLRKNNRSDLLTMISHRFPGQMSGLKRRLGITMRQINRQADVPAQQRGYWQNTETIEREARELLKKTGVLTREAAAQYGKTMLLEATRRYYQGGIRALRAKLNLGELDRPAGYWQNPENIEKEAREVLEEEGAITQFLLVKHHKYGLMRGLKYYPGGWAGLKEKLGITSESIIPPEQANEQLRKFLEEN